MMDIFRFGFKAMGCGCEVVVTCSGKEEALLAAEAAIKEITRIEQKYSRYTPDSIVTRINEKAGIDGVDCDGETMALMRYAGMLHEQSGGLFDVTSGVLNRAWDFNKPELPGKEAVESLLELVGWNKVLIDGNTVRLGRKGMQLDLGGLGKEYAADSAAKVLYGKGIRHGFVNLAGDIRVVGAQPGDEPWKVGIRDPGCAGKLLASIPLGSGALATSGDYERYIEVMGHRYSHILNPRTGCPVDYWGSVSVVATSAIEAGSRATIAMLKGPDGLDYLSASGLMYLAVDKSGKIYHRY
ncbi:MAG: FAD:protein FMN transferase [Chlorobiaceae bacterium]|nr:FAD:protein FMN transferase [Chlorobiaceae bacterium]